MWFLHSYALQLLLSADAAVEPLAMVVEAFNASVTDETVPRLIRARQLALGAQLIRVQFLHQLDEWDVLCFLQVAWVFELGRSE